MKAKTARTSLFASLPLGSELLGRFPAPIVPNFPVLDASNTISLATIGSDNELGTPPDGVSTPSGKLQDGDAKTKMAARKRLKMTEPRANGTKPANATATATAATRLGPKASQGAINEKLRSLDRTTKPCRRWQKASINIKSFTGRAWTLPRWQTPQPRTFGESLAGSTDTPSNSQSQSNISTEPNKASNGQINGQVQRKLNGSSEPSSGGSPMVTMELDHSTIGDDMMSSPMRSMMAV